MNVMQFIEYSKQRNIIANSAIWDCPQEEDKEVAQMLYRYLEVRVTSGKAEEKI